MTELQDRTGLNSGVTDTPSPKKGRRAPLAVALLLGVAIALAFTLEIALPLWAPALSNTFTPDSQPAPLEVGSFDILRRTVSAAQA